jgi:glyoxylase-like metal-dependent hydrolase (beta-lactamase superfamily II)
MFDSATEAAYRLTHPNQSWEDAMEEVTRDGRLLLIKVGPLGSFANNGYVIADSNTNDALIVDAPAESEQVVAAARGLNVRRIIVTHRHQDHWAGIDPLLAGIDAPVFCHEDDREPYAGYVKGTLADDDEVEVGGLKLRVIHTPGHTPGSICLHLGEHLIAGDTLFPGGPGRTRSPEALTQEIDSIVTRLHSLPDNVQVYPGHGANTTIATSRSEYAVFAARQHDPALSGDVLWLR